MRAIVMWLLLGACLAIAAEPDEAKLPVVVLLGDSIRLGYAPQVAEQLAGRATIVSPAANGGDSANLLKHIDAWAILAQPAVVHLNCGIHDTKRFKATGMFQISPTDYEANLRAIVERLRSQTKATILFALTTPVIDDRAAQARAQRDYELLETSVEQYNAIARSVMRELDVPINDLHAVLGSDGEPERYLGADGVHPTSAGTAKLADAVASIIGRSLSKPVDAPRLPQRTR